MKKPVKIDPWKPAEYDIADAAAIQALLNGNADAIQQRRALDWIVQIAAGTYDLSYRSDSDRDTSFAEGKRFVGLSIVKLTKLNLMKLRES